MKSPIDDKVRYWQSMLEKWKDRGLSQMAFSMHEGIDSRRLAYWKKALIARVFFTDRVSVSKVAKSKEPADKNPEEPKLLPVNIMSESAHPSILPSALESFIYIQLNDRNRLVIPDNFNPRTLARVLEVLQKI